MSKQIEQYVRNAKVSGGKPRRRSAKFNLDPADYPEVARKAYGAARDVFASARKAREKAAAEAAKVVRDGDLTESAKARRLGEIAAAYRGEVEKAAQDFAAKQEAMEERIEKAVAEARYPDPYKLPKLDADTMTRSELQAARASLASAAASHLVHREMLLQRVDRELDRALARDAEAASTGALVDRAYRAAVASGDAAYARIFEERAQQRLEAEGSESQVKVLRLAVEDTVEERLPDEAKLLLDHRDSLREIAGTLELIETEASQPDLDLTKPSVMLGVGAQTFPSLQE